MIKNVQKYVDFLFEELHLTNEVLGVLLYGSYVLNEEDEFSDLDILIIVEENNKNICGRGNIIKDSIPIEYFIKTENDIYKELIDELEIAKVNNANFNKLIGKKESLSYCIDQAIVAISYPDNGLPIFIVGESGTGKTYFAKVTAEYIIQNKFANSSVKYFECFKYRTRIYLSTTCQEPWNKLMRKIF